MPLPAAAAEVGLKVLIGTLRDRSLLTALRLMYDHVGHAYRVTMPGFQPAIFIGPAANRQILVTDRARFKWRSRNDPVTRLLRQGVLVIDGAFHDDVRGQMDPVLHRKHVLPHIEAMWRYTDDVTQAWRNGETRDMLLEMRRVALLILMGTLFKIDFAPDMDRLWRPILALLEYISPGLWIVWPEMPRPRYQAAIEEMDDYLYYIIRKRRAELDSPDAEVEAGDLLGRLIRNGMEDGLIRDQLLTMLIAGHDTSTAFLAWALYLLGSHPDAMAKARAEVDRVLPDASRPPTVEELEALDYLELVNKETLRLYPPIHVGNRFAGEDTCVQGYRVPEGTRVMYSIFLSHRDRDHWAEPDVFRPERFDVKRDEKRPALTYVPFGGGPRNCIGAAFAQVEAKVVLGRLLQTFDLTLVEGQKIRPYMGATLEPRPGVLMRVQRRG